MLLPNCNRAVGGAGAGADINGIVVDVGILADAAQHREHKAYQQERGRKTERVRLIRFDFAEVCQEKAHPFLPGGYDKGVVGILIQNERHTRATLSNPYAEKMRKKQKIAAVGRKTKQDSILTSC